MTRLRLVGCIVSGGGFDLVMAIEAPVQLTRNYHIRAVLACDGGFDLIMAIQAATQLTQDYYMGGR